MPRFNLYAARPTVDHTQANPAPKTQATRIAAVGNLQCSDDTMIIDNTKAAGAL